MIVGKVIGTIIATIKHPAYHGRKLFLIQPMHLSGQTEDEAFVAIDAAQAGIGDTVLVMREGNGARQITQLDKAPIISVVVGILDSVEINEII